MALKCSTWDNVFQGSSYHGIYNNFRWIFNWFRSQRATQYRKMFSSFSLFFLFLFATTSFRKFFTSSDDCRLFQRFYEQFTDSNWQSYVFKFIMTLNRSFVPVFQQHSKISMFVIYLLTLVHSILKLAIHCPLFFFLFFDASFLVVNARVESSETFAPWSGMYRPGAREKVDERNSSWNTE